VYYFVHILPDAVNVLEMLLKLWVVG